MCRARTQDIGHIKKDYLITSKRNCAIQVPLSSDNTPDVFQPRQMNQTKLRYYEEVEKIRLVENKRY